MHKSTTDTK